MKFEATGEYKPFLSYKGIDLFYREENGLFLGDLNLTRTITSMDKNNTYCENYTMKLEAESLEELDQNFKSFVDAFS